MAEMNDDADTEDEPESEARDMEEFISAVSSPTVSGNNALNSGRESVEEGRSKRSRVVEQGGGCGGGGGAILLIGDENVECSQGKVNRTETDGFSCPICVEAWTNEGDHQICCLPCGHLYGFSCISKLLTVERGSAKCPQCDMECSLEDVWKLFAPRISAAAVDSESQKMIQSLKKNLAYLEGQMDTLRKLNSEIEEHVMILPGNNILADDADIQTQLRAEKQVDRFLAKINSMLDERASRNRN